MRYPTIWLDNHRSRTSVFGDLLGMAAVLEKLGTDKQFIAYIRSLPSCVSGGYSEYLHGEGRCIAAHVRRAGSSGVGLKGSFSCVPLTDAEHRLQHQKGESALRPKFWWDEQVDLHRQEWAALCLRDKLGLTGKKADDIVKIEKWIDDNDLTDLYDDAVAALPSGRAGNIK